MSGDEKDSGGGLSDILKKVVNTGVSAAFMTEDAIKNMVSDLPLPKELVQGLITNAKNTRDDFITSVKSELKTRLDKIDISKEIDRIAENYDFEVNATIKLVPKNKKTTKTTKK
jgi:hypothetical protein